MKEAFCFFITFLFSFWVQKNRWEGMSNFSSSDFAVIRQPLFGGRGLILEHLQSRFVAILPCNLWAIKFFHSRGSKNSEIWSHAKLFQFLFIFGSLAWSRKLINLILWLPCFPTASRRYHLLTSRLRVSEALNSDASSSIVRSLTLLLYLKLLPCTGWILKFQPY